MKRLLLPLLLAGSLPVFAQIPPGYYNNAYNGAVPKTCADLKTALFQIITTDTLNIPYNSSVSSVFDTRDAVNKLDRRRNDANTADIIWDMYTDNPTGPEVVEFRPVTDQCGSTTQPVIGFCYNREHSFPMAWFGGSIQPMRTDMHALFATDAWSNARHDNYPYGEVGTAEWTSPAGAKLGTCSFPGYRGKVFEPIDAYKGDFARAMFYMVTCYQNFMPNWVNNGIADSVLDGTTWPSLEVWAIRQWYKWHLLDPVSQKEINRNDSIYVFQRNRNPYIDHPEFVELVWRCTNVLPVTLTGFTAVPARGAVELNWTVTDEVSFRQYEVERSSDGRRFSTIGTVAAASLSAYAFTDERIPANGTLYYRLKMVDADGRSRYSKTVAIKLQAPKGSLQCYPNPAQHELNILSTTLNTGQVKVTVTDLAGRVLISRMAPVFQGRLSLDVRSLPAGRYQAALQTGEVTENGSFVIVR